jgi:hypothetical protein
MDIVLIISTISILYPSFQMFLAVPAASIAAKFHNVCHFLNGAFAR